MKYCGNKNIASMWRPFDILCPLASLQVMRYPERVSRKQTQRKKSVRLCLSKNEEDEKSVIQEEEVEKLSQTASLQTEHFEDAVCQLAQLCLVHVNEKNSEKHLVFLAQLLQSFHTPRIFSVSQRTIFTFLYFFFLFCRPKKKFIQCLFYILSSFDFRLFG